MLRGLARARLVGLVRRARRARRRIRSGLVTLRARSLRQFLAEGVDGGPERPRGDGPGDLRGRAAQLIVVLAGVLGGVPRRARHVRCGGLTGGAGLAGEALDLGLRALGGIAHAVGGGTRRALGGGATPLGLVAGGGGEALHAVGELAGLRAGGVGGIVSGVGRLLDAATHLVTEAGAPGGVAAAAQLPWPPGNVGGVCGFVCHRAPPRLAPPVPGAP